MNISCTRFTGCKNMLIIDGHLTLCMHRDRGYASMVCPHHKMINILDTDNEDEVTITGGHIYKGEVAKILKRYAQGKYDEIRRYLNM